MMRDPMNTADPPAGPRFVPGIAMPDPMPSLGLWFLFRERDLLVATPPSIPNVRDPADLGLQPVRTQFLGMLDGMPCFSGELPANAPPPPGMEFCGLRPLFGRLPDPLFWLAARAVQVVDWDRTHQFCGSCGLPTAGRTTERARECPRCGLLVFPRLAPAVIILINKGEEVLLARGPHFTPGMYSVIAGFVEPGESLEEAAVREIQEEVGLNVRDLCYFGSQPWPFPHSLMIAFTAAHASGEIRVDPRELEDARWFRFDQLPPLPGPLSVSRRLIEWFRARHGTG